MKHFIVTIFYQVPPESIGEHLIYQHYALLHEGCYRGVFLLYGPQESEDGAVAVARSESHQALSRFLMKDPLFVEGLATYDILEFRPTEFPDFIKGWVDPLRICNPFPLECEGGVFI